MKAQDTFLSSPSIQNQVPKTSLWAPAQNSQTPIKRQETESRGWILSPEMQAHSPLWEVWLKL